VGQFEKLALIAEKQIPRCRSGWRAGGATRLNWPSTHGSSCYSGFSCPVSPPRFDFDTGALAS